MNEGLSFIFCIFMICFALIVIMREILILCKRKSYKRWEETRGILIPLTIQLILMIISILYSMYRIHPLFHEWLIMILANFGMVATIFFNVIRHGYALALITSVLCFIALVLVI